jgi:hypothetical protein
MHKNYARSTTNEERLRGIVDNDAMKMAVS